MNLKQAAVGLAGLIALSGCAVATNGVPSAERTRVVVFVDPAFGSQTEAALSAVDSWTQADPSLSLDVQIGACASGPSVVCIVSDPTEPGAGANGGNEVGVTARAADGSAVCRIFVNQFGPAGAQAPQAFAWAVAHELGHAMGLVHTGAGTLMAPTFAEAATAPTAADVAQLDFVVALKK